MSRTRLFHRWVDNTPEGVVETYARPSGAPAASTKFSVTVNNNNSVVYGTPVESGESFNSGYFTNFAFKDGHVVVRVTNDVAVNEVKIMPSEKNVAYEVNNRTISFQIEEPGNYVVWVNGNKREGLYLFANALEPKPAVGDVTYYYGPGFYGGTLPNGTALTNQTLTLNSNQSVYFDGGAYFVGHINVGAPVPTDGASYANTNIRVSGNGIVDSSPQGNNQDILGTTESRWGRPMMVNNVNSATISGLTMLSVTHWGVILAESLNINLNGVKMFSWRNRAGDTPDGIDIMGSSYVNFDKVFIRSHDDASAIKNFKQGNGASSPNGWSGSTEQINYSNCFFINGPGGNGSEIGYENFTTKVDGTPFTNRTPTKLGDISYKKHTVVKFRDPNINYRMAALGIHLVDRLPLSNVLYEDVVVEDVVNGQFSIWVGSFYTSDYSSYPNATTEEARCAISNITYRRVKINTSGVFPIHLQGGSANKPLSNVTFDNVYVNGQKVTSAGSVADKYTWEESNVQGLTFL